MLKQVDPLRRELKTLEHQAEETRVKGEEINKIITELEQSIARYQEEYAVLISDSNAIKADLATVEAKVCLCNPYFLVLMHLCSVCVCVCVCVCVQS